MEYIGNEMYTEEIADFAFFCLSTCVYSGDAQTNKSSKELNSKHVKVSRCPQLDGPPKANKSF